MSKMGKDNFDREQAETELPIPVIECEIEDHFISSPETQDMQTDEAKKLSDIQHMVNSIPDGDL